MKYTIKEDNLSKQDLVKAYNSFYQNHYGWAIKNDLLNSITRIMSHLGEEIKEFEECNERFNTLIELTDIFMTVNSLSHYCGLSFIGSLEEEVLKFIDNYGNTEYLSKSLLALKLQTYLVEGFNVMRSRNNAAIKTFLNPQYFYSHIFAFCVAIKLRPDDFLSLCQLKLYYNDSIKNNLKTFK